MSIWAALAGPEVKMQKARRGKSMFEEVLEELVGSRALSSLECRSQTGSREEPGAGETLHVTPLVAVSYFCLF